MRNSRGSFILKYMEQETKVMLLGVSGEFRCK